MELYQEPVSLSYWPIQTWQIEKTFSSERVGEEKDFDLLIDGEEFFLLADAKEEDNTLTMTRILYSSLALRGMGQ